MTMSNPGEIWLADIPYTTGIAAKKRPVLVLWIDGQDVVVASITSAGPRSASDVVLKEWAKAGLRVPSTVRLARLDCIENSLLLRRMGLLQSVDADEIRDVWDRRIKPQF